MGTSRRLPLVASVLCLALAVVGCVHRTGGDQLTPGAGAPAGAAAAGESGDGTYLAPEVPKGPALFVSQDGPFNAYNSHTPDTDTPGNTLVLNQVLADPFIVDGDGSFLLNTDVMVSAKLTSQDPQVVTYEIKPGVTWSDGEPWDCDDFYLAWLAGSGKAVMRGPDGKPVTDAQGNKTSYFTPATTQGYERAIGECRDDLTFIETYQAPYVDWRRNYVQNAILPAHVLEQQAGIADVTALGPDSPQEELKRAGDFWSRGWLGFRAETMPASGPYRIDSATPGGEVVLARNKNWQGNPGGPEKVVLVAVGSGTDLVTAMREQRLSIVAPPPDPTVTAGLRGLADQGVVVDVRGGSRTESLDINMARPLFQETAVRAALAQCVDRNELVEELVREVMPQAQPLGSQAFLPEDEHYEDLYSEQMPADPRQAQLTLEKAGWVLGEDGVYARSGQRLSFTIAHDGSVSHVRAVELIRKQCRQSGMEITGAPAPEGDFTDTLAAGEFDVALVTTTPVPRVSSMSDRYSGAGLANYQGYHDSEVDDALAVAETEYAQSTQIEALQRADRLIAEDLVSFPLYQVPIVCAYSDSIDNVFRHATDGVTWNANEWAVR